MLYKMSIQESIEYGRTLFDDIEFDFTPPVTTNVVLSKCIEKCIEKCTRSHKEHYKPVRYMMHVL